MEDVAGESYNTPLTAVVIVVPMHVESKRAQPQVLTSIWGMDISCMWSFVYD